MNTITLTERRKSQQIIKKYPLSASDRMAVWNGAVALANIFCWAAALLYAQMASKSVTFSMPFFINAVHSQASLSACLISGCFVFNYQNLCPF